MTRNHLKTNSLLFIILQLYVRNKEGEVIKGQPIWVVRPKRIEISSHPHPESKQLLNQHTYDIKVDIYDKDDHLIYPSKVRPWNDRTSST